nr:unnamed protein product [Callosobruchus analis]
MDSNSSVEKLMDKSIYLIAEQNRQKLTPTIKTIIFCGRMGIALRGHKDYGPLDIKPDFSNLDRTEGKF